MNKNHLFIVLITLITFPISCALERDNLLDESGSQYINPNISFNEALTDVKDQDTVHSDSITLTLEGNNDHSIFYLSLDDGIWVSEWQNEGSFGIGNLSDGKHILFIDSKYEEGEIIVSDTVNFFVKSEGFKPKFEKLSDSTIESFEKKPLYLYTPVEGAQPIKYLWLKDTGILSDKNKDTLSFKPFLKRDEAYYKCVAINEYGKDTSRTFKLKYRPSEGTIKGIVIDTASKPFNNVTIKIIPLNKETSTSNRGYFEFEDLPEDSYALKFMYEGYQTLVIEGISVNDSDEIDLDTISYTDIEEDTYKVRYKDNGSDSGSVPVDSIVYDPESKVVILDNKGKLYKEGYIFIGWNTKEDGSGDTYNPNDSFSISKSITLFALWDPKEYTLSFIGNGNTSGNCPNDRSYEYGSEIKLSDMGTLEKKGYDFDSWNTEEDGNGDEYRVESNLKILGNITLYAQWKSKTVYEIIYDSNDADSGSVPDINEKYYEGEEVLIEGNPGKLYKNGFTFTGWNTIEDGSGQSYNSGSKFIMRDTIIILYAEWTSKPIYKLTYHGNDVDSGDIPDQISADSGTQIIISDNILYREGYVFIGWNTKEDGSGKEYGRSSKLVMGVEDVHLYAQWDKALYTITYHGNDFTGGEIPPTTKHKYDSETIAASGESIQKIGCTFYSWNTDSLGEGIDYLPGTTIKNITENIDLFAKWTKEHYSIIFRFNNGKKDSVIIVDYGDTLKMEDPLKEGYVFADWTTDEENTEVWDLSKRVGESLILYAKWIIRDIDGNVYTEVKIGNQIWMVENLKTTRYNDGTSIEYVEHNTLWENLSTGAYCWWGNNPNKKEVYGALYNWYVVYSNRLAPKGWHVPTSEEWEILIDYLGGKSIAGGKLKEPGIEHWVGENPIIKGSISGFQGLPGGERFDDGSYYNLLNFGSWWSATSGVPNTAFCYSLSFGNTEVFIEGRSVNLGLSVRCIKDDVVAIDRKIKES